MAAALAACNPGEPPGATTPAIQSVAPTASGARTGPAVAVEPADAALAPPDAGQPLSLAADDATLEQTEARPTAQDPLTLARARALFEALAADDPARGQDFFFPLDAYKQVKDSHNPESDWKGRLIAAYARDVHELRRARPELKDSRFVGLEIPDAGVKWVKPGEEYNKIGYYRVFKSSLVYETASGQNKAIELKSLISWRGRFFLVHLSSFK